MVKLNSTSPLQPEESDRLIEIFTVKVLAQDVWDGVVEQNQSASFSKDLLLGLAPMFLKWFGNLHVVAREATVFQTIYSKFEWLMRCGNSQNVAPAYEEIFVKTTKIFEHIQLWWVGFSYLELMI